MRAPLPWTTLGLALCLGLVGRVARAAPGEAGAPDGGAVGADAAEAGAGSKAASEDASAGGAEAGAPAVDAGSPSTAAAPAGPPAGPKPSASQPRSTSRAPTGPAHQQGKPPKKPSAKLPPGAPRAVPSAAVRQQLSGAPSAEQRAAGVDDPELSQLRQSERALFARPLRGFVPGWSWDAPIAHDDSRVDPSGLPPSVSAEPPPGVTDSSATNAEWLRTLTLPDLPVRFDERVVRYLEFYRDDPKGRAIAKIWARKLGRYSAALRAELAKHGLPTDLVYLSLIESGHNPSIASPAGAAGLWQFMPATGRLYGLTVDRWVDERLDPERATEAAALYLGDLYRRFGTWELAMAGYNMGHGGLVRTVRRFSSNDFWELSRLEAAIPWETTLYVPKILATAVVMRNLKAFGLDQITPEPPESFDVVRVAPGTTLSEVARAAALEPRVVEQLNPMYLAGRTPPASGPTLSYKVRLPPGTGALASQGLAGSADAAGDLVVVRVGDTVETLAAARGTTPAALRRLNSIGAAEVLEPGTVLLAPRLEAGAQPGADTEEVVVVPARQFRYAGRERVFYRVVAGDSLARIAQAFGVGSHELLLWNALDPSARLQSDMVLQVFVPPSQSLSGVRYVREASTRVLVAGSPEFIDYFEGLSGKRRIVIKVAEGETLFSIGQRYGMSVGWMERINRFSRTKKLKVGQSIIVYAKVPGQVPAGTADVTPLPPVVAGSPESLPELPPPVTSGT